MAPLLAGNDSRSLLLLAQGMEVLKLLRDSGHVRWALRSILMLDVERLRSGRPDYGCCTFACNGKPGVRSRSELDFDPYMEGHNPWPIPKTKPIHHCTTLTTRQTCNPPTTAKLYVRAKLKVSGKRAHLQHFILLLYRFYVEYTISTCALPILLAQRGQAAGSVHTIRLNFL